MKITRKQLRRLIIESITNIKSGPVGQVPYEHPGMELKRAAGDKNAEKLKTLLKSPNKENRVTGDDLADTLGYESEFGSYIEDEFEHNVRMASKDPSEDVHEFVRSIIFEELRSVRNKKEAYYTRGGDRSNIIGDAYDDIDIFLTNLKNQHLSPRQALNQLWNKISTELNSGKSRMLAVLRRLMKELARESLFHGFISKKEGHRYMGDAAKHYGWNEEEARAQSFSRAGKYRK